MYKLIIEIRLPDTFISGLALLSPHISGDYFSIAVKIGMKKKFACQVQREVYLNNIHRPKRRMLVLSDSQRGKGLTLIAISEV